MAFWNTDPGFDPNAYSEKNAQNLTAAEQQDFLARLNAQAMGTAPSPAALMLQQNAQKQQAQMLGQAAAARGVNPALALRNAQIAGVQATQAANAEGAVAKAREQLQAQALLGQTLGQARGQDIQNAQGYNQLAMQKAIADQGATSNVIGSGLGALGTLGAVGLGFLGGGKGKPGSGGNVSGSSTPGLDGGSTDPFQGAGTSGSSNGFGEGSSGNFGGEGMYAAHGGLVRMAEGGDPSQVDASDGSLGASALPEAAMVTPPAYQNLSQDLKIIPMSQAAEAEKEWQRQQAASPEAVQGRKDAVAAAAAKSAAATSNSLVKPDMYRESSLASQAPAGPPGAGQHVMLAQGGSIPGGPKSFIAKHLAMAKGGKVPAMVSPGERYLNKEQATEVAQGKKQAISAGVLIPGKPKVPGAKNSYANDTVPKTLQAGGVVVPRSITQAPDAKTKADAFVKAVLSHKKAK